ncbi:MAG: DUF58 domain-containing protein [Phycisphaerales bacterium]|jgi:uncharacterized protein (DUF58 family)|nr:DUF58 domain-containing protein [Phycisphaerales bacterium]
MGLRDRTIRRGLDEDGARIVRRQYHLHFPGIVYAMTTMLIALGAFNGPNNLLLWVFGLGVGGLVVSGIISGSSLMGVRIDRRAPERASVGQAVGLRYIVRNRNRVFPAFAMAIDEEERPDSAHTPSAGVAHVGPRESVIASTSWVFDRRGEFTLRRIVCWSTFPFGLAKKSVVFEHTQHVLVRPMDLPLRPGIVPPAYARGMAGASATQRLGPGDEFFGVREYVPGDAPRSISWRRSAITDALVVRQPSSPSPRRMRVVLDLPLGSDDIAWPAWAEAAIALAGAVLGEGERLGYSTALDAPGLHLPFARGPAHRGACLDALARLAPRSAHLGTIETRGASALIVHIGRTPAQARGAISLDPTHPDAWLSSRTTPQIRELLDASLRENVAANGMTARVRRFVKRDAARPAAPVPSPTGGRA